MSDNSYKKVFISYSHDTKEHKEKVRVLADILRSVYAVDVIGDFYDEDNPMGGQLPDLMEKIRVCDRVICILTPTYKIRADEGKGGVGYEKTIITDQLFQDIGSAKFIPVSLYENIEFAECAPNFLTLTRKALLRSNYASDDLFFEEIARSILDMPKNPKPPLGKNKLLSASRIDAETIDIKAITQDSSHDIIFNNALFYAKSNDENNFRLLLKKVKNQVFIRLKELKEEHQKIVFGQNTPDLPMIMDQFVNAASPLFLIAFAGYLSFNDRFHYQTGLLIDLLTIEGWNEKGGLTVICDIPKLLAYAYHHVYGALNVDNERINNLTKIFEQKIPAGQCGEYEYLYKVREVTGWIRSLGGDCFKSFDYLLNAFQRWKWLRFLFNDERDYQKTLVCYQATINLLNYFVSVKSGYLSIEDRFSTYCEVPPSSIVADDDLKNYLHHYLVKNSDFFNNYLIKNGISKKSAVDQWNLWLKEISKFNTIGISFGCWIFKESAMNDILM